MGVKAGLVPPRLDWDCCWGKEVCPIRGLKSDQPRNSTRG